MSKLISIIIPTYNEQETIGNCLSSLRGQSYEEVEIIVVDDGSVDNTKSIVKKLNVKLLSQNHQGPGTARNLGAKYAKGEILVFVDADMTFEKNFIRDLVKPIDEKKTVGTFSKNELLANYENIWAKCWSINRNWKGKRLIAKNSPNTSPVFRAIKKHSFEKVKGFDTTGEYTDDWSLSRKLGEKALVAKGATYYHFNPSTLKEVTNQAKWFSTNMFISGNILRKMKSIVFYSLPFSLIIGVYKSIKERTFLFIFFKVVFDYAVWTSIIRSLF